MNRRKAMKVTAGILAGSGAGLFTLSQASGIKNQPDEVPHKLDYSHPEGSWNYVPLDPAETAQRAYDFYSEGSCMYGTMKSVISQLAEKIGEPYASFPVHMFKYGHGGIGGYGSVCGTLNGAAALAGLLIAEKSVQDRMITDLFQWYEKEPFPAYKPARAVPGFEPAASVSGSVLCHASNTNWCNTTGFKAASAERKERCRRLTADVAMKITASLNDVMSNAYITGSHANESASTCLTCHGDDGKLKNVSVKMNCNSCHSESIGHHIFSDIHYKLMKE